MIKINELARYQLGYPQTYPLFMCITSSLIPCLAGGRHAWVVFLLLSTLIRHEISLFYQGIRLRGQEPVDFRAFCKGYHHGRHS
jgi:hypothetical protein